MPDPYTDCRLEAWTLPSSGALTQVIDLPIPYSLLTYEQKLRGVTTGRFEVSGLYEKLNLICDPENEVECLMRVFERNPWTDTWHNVQSFISRFVDDEYQVNNDAVISGPDIKDELDHYLVYPFDWATYDTGEGSSVTGISTFLDTIYGGQNLLENPGFEDGGFNNTTIGISTNAETGTFTLTFDGQTTGAIDVEDARDDPDVIKSALEALSNIVGVDVRGSGTVNSDPWMVEIVDPGQQLNNLFTFDTTNLNPPAGITLVFNVVYKFPTGGTARPDPWTRSTDMNTGAVYGGYTAFDVGSVALYGDPARSGDRALGIDPAPGTSYSGAQQIVDVDGRGVYYASAWIWAFSANQTYRLVIRDLNEVEIARAEITPAAQTWTQVEIPAVAIPAHVSRVVFRVATITPGAPTDLPAFWIDDAEFAPGLERTTIGQIFLNLKTTATAEARALAGWLDFDFTGTQDSSAADWDRDDVTVLIPLGATWLNVVEIAERRGYEVVLVHNAGDDRYKLRMYNPGAAGTHREADSYPVFSVPAVSNAQVRKQNPRANVVLAEGPGGLVVEVVDPASTLPRRESFIYVDEALDAADLLAAAEHEMAKIQAERYSVKILETYVSVGEGLDCQVGDTVHHDLPPKLPPMDLRVVTAQTTWSTESLKPTRTIDTGKEVFREERGGTTSSATSEAVNYLLRQLRKPKRREVAAAPVVAGGPSDISRPAILYPEPITSEFTTWTFDGGDVFWEIVHDPDKILQPFGAHTDEVAFVEPGLYLIEYQLHFNYEVANTGWAQWEILSDLWTSGVGVYGVRRPWQGDVIFTVSANDNFGIGEALVFGTHTVEVKYPETDVYILIWQIWDWWPQTPGDPVDHFADQDDVSLFGNHSDFSWTWLKVTRLTRKSSEWEGIPIP